MHISHLNLLKMCAIHAAEATWYKLEMAYVLQCILKEQYLVVIFKDIFVTGEVIKS